MKVISEPMDPPMFVSAHVTADPTLDGGNVVMRFVSWGPVTVVTMTKTEARALATALHEAAVDA